MSWSVETRAWGRGCGLKPRLPPHWLGLCELLSLCESWFHLLNRSTTCFTGFCMGQVREDPKHIQPRVGCTRRSVLDLPVLPATAALSGLTSDPRAAPPRRWVSPWTPGPRPQSGSCRCQGTPGCRAVVRSLV